jgi:hypothetical protein
VEKTKAEGNTAFTTIKKGQQLSIKDSKGNVLFEKTVEKSNTIEQAFDYATLQNGYYTLEVNKDFQIEVIPFTVVSGKTTFYSHAEKTIYKPVVRTENNSLLVSKIDFTAAPLHVTIYYEGEVIFKDIVRGGHILHRVYKLRKDSKGDYKVVMKANDRTYSNEFSL